MASSSNLARVRVSGKSLPSSKDSISMGANCWPNKVCLAFSTSRCSFPMEHTLWLGIVAGDSHCHRHYWEAGAGDTVIDIKIVVTGRPRLGYKIKNQKIKREPYLPVHAGRRPYANGWVVNGKVGLGTPSLSEAGGLSSLPGGRRTVSSVIGLDPTEK